MPILFGADTPAGTGGYAASSFTPDANNHFELSGGKIVPTSTGASAGLNLGPYSVTVNGQAETITILPNTTSVETFGQITTAVTAYSALPNQDSTILIRTGVTISGDTWSPSINLNGTYSDVNWTGSGFVTKYNWDREAVATISGGSITIKAETPLGVVWSMKIQPSASTINGLIFDGIDFDVRSSEIVWSMGTSGNTAAAKTYKLDFDSVTAGAIIFQNCRYGSWAHAPEPKGLWVTGVFWAGGTHFIVQDSTFDGYFIAIQMGGAKHCETRRVISKRRAADFHRIYEVSNGGISGQAWYAMTTITEYKCLGFEWDPDDDWGYAWVEEHADAIQYNPAFAGTNTDYTIYAIDWCLDNRVRSDVGAEWIRQNFDGTGGLPDLSGSNITIRRGMQGIHGGGTNNSINVVVEFLDYLAVANSANAYNYNGIQVTANMDRTAMLYLDYGTPPLFPVRLWKVTATNAYNPPGIFKNSVFSNLDTSGSGITRDNVIDLNILSSSGAASYYDNLAGAFTPGDTGPMITIDTSSDANFRASMIAAFTAEPGSPVEGSMPELSTLEGVGGPPPPVTPPSNHRRPLGSVLLMAGSGYPLIG